MAAKKSGGVEKAFAIGVTVLIVIVAYKLLFGKKVSAASGGYVTSPNLAGYGGTQQIPYAAQPSSGNSLLDFLAKLLGGNKAGGSSGGGSGSSGGSGGATTGAAAAKGAQTQAQLQTALKNIASYTNQGANAANPDLGGYSLANLPVGYLSDWQNLPGVNPADFSIPNVPGGNGVFDFGTSGFSPGDPTFDTTPWSSIASYTDWSYSNPMDTSSPDTGSIDSIPLQNFDFGSSYY